MILTRYYWVVFQPLFSEGKKKIKYRRPYGIRTNGPVDMEMGPREPMQVHTRQKTPVYVCKLSKRTLPAPAAVVGILGGRTLGNDKHTTHPAFSGCRCGLVKSAKVRGDRYQVKTEVPRRDPTETPLDSGFHDGSSDLAGEGVAQCDFGIPSSLRPPPQSPHTTHFRIKARVPYLAQLFLRPVALSLLSSLSTGADVSRTEYVLCGLVEDVASPLPSMCAGAYVHMCVPPPAGPRGSISWGKGRGTTGFLFPKKAYVHTSPYLT